MTGKVVVITGASSGIGAALVEACAARGDRVGLLARRREPMDALAERIRQAGGVAEVEPADVTDRAATVAAVHALQDRLGPIDLLIANSGVSVETLIEPMNTADIENMFRVNLFGILYAFEAALPKMIERRAGHLVGISSLASYKGLPGKQGYCASKAAVNVFLEGLRIQLYGSGIHVTTVCPGFIRTPMTEQFTHPMPGMMDADKAARRILRAIDRKVRVYNFPWWMRLLMQFTKWASDGMMYRRLVRKIPHLRRW